MVMHETSVYTTTVALGRVTQKAVRNTMCAHGVFNAVLQYLLAVLVLCVLARPLVSTFEHLW
jgi:spore maturation protein SpmB